MVVSSYGQGCSAAAVWRTQLELRLVHVIDSLGRGGAETLLLHLAPHLLELGMDVRVIALRPPLELKQPLEACGVQVSCLDLRSFWAGQDAIPRLRNKLLAWKPDVIHAHLFFSCIYVASASLWPHRALRVASLHSLEYDAYPPTTVAKRVRRQVHGLLLRLRMQRVFAVSRAVASHYSQHLGLREVEVVPNAIPVRELADVAGALTAEDRASIRGGFGLSSEGWLVISVGRFVREKDHISLIEAIAEVRDRGVDCRLAIVGAGGRAATADYRHRIKALGLDEHVHLLPPMAHPRLMPLVASSDVFALTSFHEGFGIAVVEAMALGVPVVASSIAAFRELLSTEAGFLVSPGQPQQIARALQTLLESPSKRKDFAHNAARSAKERFDAAVLARVWKEKYASLAG